MTTQNTRGGFLRIGDKVLEEDVTKNMPAPRRKDVVDWHLGQAIAKDDGVDLLGTKSRLMPRQRLGI